jgi:hypothetical protein
VCRVCRYVGAHRIRVILPLVECRTDHCRSDASRRPTSLYSTLACAKAPFATFTRSVHPLRWRVITAQASSGCVIVLTLSSSGMPHTLAPAQQQDLV